MLLVFKEEEEVKSVKCSRRMKENKRKDILIGSSEIWERSFTKLVGGRWKPHDKHREVCGKEDEARNILENFNHGRKSSIMEFMLEVGRRKRGKWCPFYSPNEPVLKLPVALNLGK